jgi:Ni/Co efflux regulator RcnB
MTRFCILLVASFLAAPLSAFAQEAMKKDSAEWTKLEKVLWDADQQWLCSSGEGPYHTDIKDCVEFRSKYWADQFFEVGATGKVSTKAEMVASQTAGIPTHVHGVGPYPENFKLMAVYGNFAMATDHTRFKTVDANGKVNFTSEVTFLRLFVKEDGKWRPAAGAAVPIVTTK